MDTEFDKDIDYKAFAIELAYQAGEIMRKNFTLNMKKEWKWDHSPVTETDLAINELVLKKIKEKFPDHDILSEEGNEVHSGSEYIWICDPVDGTHNFSHGIPTSTFVLALTHKGLPIIGVIYDPFLDRMFSAEKGKGAMVNGQPIHVSKSKVIQKTVIGLGKWNDVCNLFSTGKEINAKGVRLVTGLSINYMGALVAVGEMSAVLFGGKSAYDNVAVKILVEEAGGKVTNLFGDVEDYSKEVKGQLSSNGYVHEEILEIIKKNV
ncbi:inositol monophosphatase [Candidatus Woesearchaeota archaeon]|nr:inositol monophosphatase [Candidatus Woesearchaeota archaeon]